MKITVNTNNKLYPLGDLFGIFFEDLNHAADGGLYGELVRNRGFEFDAVDNLNYNHLTAWETEILNDARASVSIQYSRPYNVKNPHYAVIDSVSKNGDIGIINQGYNSGIPLEKGKKYNFSCLICCDGRPAEVEISLESAKTKIKYDTFKFRAVTKNWIMVSNEFTSSETDYSARLALRLKSQGRIYIDNVSMFPQDTFNARQNGLRKDLAEHLKNLHPKFMRFPGGCLVHDGSLNSNDRDSMYRWKNTIGGVYGRPSRKSNWGYNQSLGLGFYEYFILCEDIGAKPLPVVPGGYDPHHQRKAPFSQMDEWVQDALDLIEFANGGEDTEWGRKRCELGHKEPFGLEYIGIGNEEVGEGFFERYPLFHNAIREKYPDIKIINSGSPFVAGGEYNRGWKSAGEYKSDLIDEHYYLAPEWFIANNHHYDTVPYDGTKVFLGEYASWGNTWYNALAEASYMTGLERNAERVGLACYAPLFSNVDYTNWSPDMIWFDNHRSFVTPNYYVQQLFMKNQGDTAVECRIETDEENELRSDNTLRDVYISPQSQTQVNYTDIVIYDGENRINVGNISVNENDKPIKIGTVNSEKYCVTMKAVMTGGIKGFMLWFDCNDKENKRSWEIGGWQNMDCAVCEDMNGRNSCLNECMFTVEQNREYTLTLEVDGKNIETYIEADGEKQLMNKTQKTEIIVEPLYCVASVDEKSGDTIIKAVNLMKKAHKTQIVTDCKGCDVDVYKMYGYEMSDENSFDEPDKVVPECGALSAKDGCFEGTIPPESVCVFRIKGE